ncbi:hypothetical protein [Halosimplex pelagicum]|uniref:DUF7312 domain-containing protein n=1 Tax=Halosimplex pelagicum TaxID=869886 RepID=A0A7D5P8J9_9EURY|nr:hypothetical protein [Halosimplex pelagicum]QLH81941.1 hypothetical protein HZS54_10010 [Halosimplex pelagicum]
MADDAGTEDDEEEWRFSVDEVGDDTGDVEEADTLDDEDGWDVTVGDEDDDGPTVAFGGTDGDDHAAGDGEDGEGGGNVAGSVTPELPVESDTPSLESAVFVAAGALLVLLVFASVVTPLTPPTVGGITLGVTAVTALLYAVFVRF